MPADDPCKELANVVAELQADYLALRKQLAQAPPDQRAELAKEIFQALHEVNAARLALSECRSRPPNPNVILGGAEYTQAVQYFRSMLDPCPDLPGQSGPCPDNGLALVAGKTTIVRTYAGIRKNPSVPIRQLNAVLETRQTGSQDWNAPLVPYTAEFIDAGDPAAIDRSNPAQTLNFRIPAFFCFGSLEYRITVFEPAHSGVPDYSNVGSGVMQFSVTRALRIRLVRIRYQNAARGMDVAAPTTAEFWTTAQYVLKTFPIPNIDVVADSEELYDGDFTSFFESGGPGAQGTTGTVFQILYRLLQAENLPPDVLYFGLIPTGPANRTAPGWAAGGMSIGTNLDGSTMAQEIGHNRGLPNHAPCGQPPSPDPNYPVYGSYFSGSIGEYGFDNTDNVVYQPADFADFMSYCRPTWISPYTHNVLLRVFGGGQRVQGISGELLQFRLTMRGDQTCAMEGAAFHLPRSGAAQQGFATPYVLELHNQAGEVIEALPLTDDDFDRAGNDPTTFSVAIPWHEDATALVVMEGDKTLYTTPIKPRAPSVSFVVPVGATALKGRVKVAWTGHPSANLTYILRYSYDGGKTWRALAAGLKAREYTVDFDSLPGGVHCVLQVLASSGVRTASATSAPFSVALKPAGVLIVAPQDGATFGPKQPVALWGAVDAMQGDASPQDLEWSSSLDGVLGTGAQVCADRISAGSHRITLSLPNRPGASQAVSIQVAR